MKDNRLSNFPFYEPRIPPKYYEYHEKVDFLDELEKIWGKQWGAQGIGKLREVGMIRPLELETDPIFLEDPEFFQIHEYELPKWDLMIEQWDTLVKTLKENGVDIHFFEYDETPRSAYGIMRRAISAAAASVVVKGGAIVPREATQYWRGRSKYVTKWLVEVGCPILYTVHGKGVCEVGAFTALAEDTIVCSLSTDCNREGLDQVTPIFHRAGITNIVVAHSPGPNSIFYPEAVGWMHSDMWIGAADVGLVVLYPPFCDYETVRWLTSNNYRIIEVPRGEQLKLYPCNFLTLEPGKVIMIEGAGHTSRMLRKEGVDVIEIPYAEVLKYGGGIRCTVARLIRDRGPSSVEIKG
ncbi:MAG: arginine deiminase family protein [Nitrososphaerota archaeon]